MELPLWLSQAMQDRLDEVMASIENDPALRQERHEERRLFYAMFDNESIIQSLEFKAWEDQHHYKHSLIQEQLYKQGMQDGIQLVYSLWQNVREF